MTVMQVLKLENNHYLFRHPEHQDLSMQYTIEFENENKQLNFLHVTFTNTGKNLYYFKIFWKTLITNVQ